MIVSSWSQLPSFGQIEVSAGQLFPQT